MTLSKICFNPVIVKDKECLRQPKKIEILADGEKISGDFNIFLKKASNTHMKVSP